MTLTAEGFSGECCLLKAYMCVAIGIDGAGLLSVSILCVVEASLTV